MQTAQNHHLAQQTSLKQLRLDVATADHSLELAEEHAKSHQTLTTALQREKVENRTQASTAAALGDQLKSETATTLETLKTVPQPTESTPNADPRNAQHAQ